LWFNSIALAVGAIALAFVLRTLGWAGLKKALADTGLWFVAIAAVDLVSVVCDAYAIHGLLGSTVPFRKVFAAEASGIAINRLTPGNTLGEPVKITMLTRDTSTTAAVAAILLFNLTTMYVAIAAITLGVPLTALLLDLPPDAAVIAWIGLAILLAVAALIAVLIKRGALTTLIRGLARLRIVSPARASAWSERLRDLDTQLKELGDTGSRNIRRGVAGVVGSRICNGLGTFLVIRACGIAPTPALVVAMLSVGILVTWFSNLIPLGLGIADGTNYVLYGLLGATSAEGLVFTMVNRVRTVVLALMGLTIMAIANIFARR
jgi:uncharacterized membrane protein YbhN (UPF0104 family)